MKTFDSFFGITVLAAMVISSGCKKKEPTVLAPEIGAVQAAPAAEAQSAAAPENAGEAPRSLFNSKAAPATANAVPGFGEPAAETSPVASAVGEVDQFMTSQLRIFIQQKGRMPANFPEFTSARMDSVPRPPQGKKWVIDETSQSVVAVKK